MNEDYVVEKIAQEFLKVEKATPKQKEMVIQFSRWVDMLLHGEFVERRTDEKS